MNSVKILIMANEELKARATEYANSLDEIIAFKQTLLGSYLVIGIKDNKLKYMEFKDRSL